MLRDLTTILTLALALPVGAFSCAVTETQHADPAACETACSCDHSCASCSGCSSCSQECSSCSPCESEPDVCTPGDRQPCPLASATNGDGCAGIRTCDGAGYGFCVPASPSLPSGVVPSTCDAAAVFTCAAPGSTAVCGAATSATVWPSRLVGQYPSLNFEYGATGVVVDPSGGHVIAGGGTTLDFGGGKTLASSFGPGPFLASFDAAGAARWAIALDGASAEFLKIGGLPDGSTIIAGNCGGQLDIGGVVAPTLTMDSATFVARVDAAGATTWIKPLSDGLRPFITDMATSPAGDIVVAGTYNGQGSLAGMPLPTDGTIFLARIDGDGEVTRVTTYPYACANSCEVKIAVAQNGDAAAIGLAAEHDPCGSGAWLFLDPATPPTTTPADGGRRRTDLPVDPKGAAFDPSGRLVVVGNPLGPLPHHTRVQGVVAILDLAAETTQVLQLNWRPAALAASDTLVVAGFRDPEGDLHVAKYDLSLRAYDERTFEVTHPGLGLGHATFGAVALADGAPVIVGSLYGTIDFGAPGAPLVVSTDGHDDLSPFAVTFAP